MTLGLLLALPWVAIPVLFVARVRMPRPLPAPGPDGPAPARAPFVSVIVPARNEAHNLGRLLATVTASDYPRFEVVVVDDRSEDGTRDVVRAAGAGRAARLEVVEGEPLPEGWLGKPWACAQGAARARGDLLLFTDADTSHAPDLLARAVAALEEDGADALTLLGTQLMDSFWERLVQPQMFVVLLGRFPDARDPLPPARWRDAIANGQYLLFRREPYEALGGHGAVRDEVAEDLRLAQLLVVAGRRLSWRGAEDGLATRMYRGLRELVAGWGKNVAIGGLQAAPPLLRPVLLPVAVVTWAGLWLAPPLVLVPGLLGFANPAVLAWAGASTLASAAFWSLASVRMGAPLRYGLLYPLGSAVVTWIVLRSWLRGTRVEWKGREYRVRMPQG